VYHKSEGSYIRTIA